MSRYRPPKPKSAAYITPEGAQRMRDELEQLWKVERPIVTRAVTDAAALGDRSENADYQYGKRRLRQIDSRVRFLAKRLEEVTIVQARDYGTKVYFGAWIIVETEDGEKNEFRIVGPDESDVKNNAISMDSPMGKAIMGRSVGDEIVVSRPKDTAIFQILAVRYS